MKKLLAGAAALVLGFGGVAIAQSISVPQVTSVGPADLFPDVVNGQPNAQSQYTTAAQINGPVGFVRTIPLTGFSLAFANGQSYYLIVPAGTLATGTFTLSPNPGQGQRNCVRSTQTQTAVTLATSTAAGATPGQTIASAITAMTASTTYCYIYDQASGVWNVI